MSLFDFNKKKYLELIENLTNENNNLRKENIELKNLVGLYTPLINLDQEKNNKIEEIQRLELRKSELNQNYQSSLSIFANLKNMISIFETKLDQIEFGVYDPIYNFETSEQYKNKLEKIREDIKIAIKTDKAAKCDVNWTIDGSIQKGRSSTLKRKKMMIRAFNGECDVVISKVRWNNVIQMKERIDKMFQSLNKLGEIDQTYITTYYKNLRIEELSLEYEYQQKKYEEKEKEREIREKLREEERAQREFEKARDSAEKEEELYQKSLNKARLELMSKNGIERDTLERKILTLEKQLEEAHIRKERAISMAQQTRCGHVYIISNIGSFGDNIHKIGMTRRLEPIERINELGNASVPFRFDIHALIYSEDAPSLEYSLHKRFEDCRVNLVNSRKEYFNVSLEDIEIAIKEIAPDAEFIKLPEAREYRETISIRNKAKSPTQYWNNNHPGINPSEDFPDYI